MQARRKSRRGEDPQPDLEPEASPEEQAEEEPLAPASMLSVLKCKSELKARRYPLPSRPPGGTWFKETCIETHRWAVEQARAGIYPAGSRPSRSRDQTSTPEQHGTIADVAVVTEALQLAYLRIKEHKERHFAPEQGAAPRKKVFTARHSIPELVRTLCRVNPPRCHRAQDATPLEGSLETDVTSMGLHPRSTKFSLSQQVGGADWVASLRVRPTHKNSPLRDRDTLEAVLFHLRQQWSASQHKVKWLAEHLYSVYLLFWSDKVAVGKVHGISEKMRARHAAWVAEVRQSGFDSERGRSRSAEALLEFNACHDELSLSGGLGGHSRLDAAGWDKLCSRPRRQPRARLNHLSPLPAYAHQRFLLQQHELLVGLEAGDDVLERLRCMQHAHLSSSDEMRADAAFSVSCGEHLEALADEIPHGASSASMEELTSLLAVPLRAPVPAIHGKATGRQSICGAQLVDLGLVDPLVCTAAQISTDAHQAIELVKRSLLHDAEGKLVVGPGGQLAGTARFGDAYLKNGQTLVVLSTGSLNAENPDTTRVDSVLDALERCGPAFAGLTAALRVGQDSRKLRADILFYLAHDAEALSQGIWRALGQEDPASTWPSLRLSPAPLLPPPGTRTARSRA